MKILGDLEKIRRKNDKKNSKKLQLVVKRLQNWILRDCIRSRKITFSD